MSDLIPFKDGVALPSYLRSTKANNDLTAHAGVSIPKLSIKGKAFWIVRGENREQIKSQLDPKAPAQAIHVVIVKANAHKSKSFYAEAYDASAGESVAPTCSSLNGAKPDANVEDPQAVSCAVCPNNVWGSKTTGKGDNIKKGKLCNDYVAVAVAVPSAINDPMLLRVPPASIKALGEYGEFLSKRGVTYQAVVTEISMDENEATSKLVFKPVAFLDEQTFREVEEVAGGDLVGRMLGAIKTVQFSPKVEAEAKETTQALIENAKKVAETVSTDKTATMQEVETAVKAGAKKPATKSVEDLDLDDLNFDD